jgi:hypothetical protein
MKITIQAHKLLAYWEARQENGRDLKQNIQQGRKLALH